MQSKRQKTNAPPRGLVVIAEDDSDFRSYLGVFLRSRQFRVVEAKNGYEALAQLGPSADNPWLSKKCDAVLLDYHLPGVNGLEILEKLAVAGVAHKVIFMTSFADDDVMQWARLVGAAAVLCKPFPPDQLIDSIAHVAGHQTVTRTCCC